MHITAKTLDEQLLAPVGLAKMALSIAAKNGADSDRLAGLVNDVAEDEGRAFIRGVYRDALANEASPEATTRMLTKYLLNGTDDTWSGRKNDARRSRYAGMLDEVRTILDAL